MVSLPASLRPWAVWVEFKAHHPNTVSGLCLGTHTYDVLTCRASEAWACVSGITRQEDLRDEVFEITRQPNIFGRVISCLFGISSSAYSGFRGNSQTVKLLTELHLGKFCPGGKVKA
ncbi:hypothetical protein V2G26_013985 [Clonostachys chloroleuca]